MVDKKVDLAGAIDSVRNDLIIAQSQRSNQISFAVGKVVIELTGEIAATAGGSGGVKFWVVNVEGKGERSTTAMHKVSVELIPKGDITVSDGAPEPTPE